MIKVIATDMDGTFLDDKGGYDRARFERLFVTLRERGIHFVVASGNHMERLSMIFDGLTDQMSYVAENGSHVIDYQEEVVHHHLSKTDVEACLRYFDGKHKEYRIVVSTDQGLYMVDGAHFDISEFMIEEEQLQAFLSRIQWLPDFSHLPEEATYIKMSMMFPLAECDNMIAEFNQSFTGGLTAVTSGYGSVDLIATGIHKAWGLQRLLERWEITPDEVMAFGDGENDIELLQLAKYSYAMENAPESVKKVADFIAPHHSENGVLTVIEEMLLSEDTRGAS